MQQRPLLLLLPPLPLLLRLLLLLLTCLAAELWQRQLMPAGCHKQESQQLRVALDRLGRRS
jgi:hypothetical protein